MSPPLAVELKFWWGNRQVGEFSMPIDAPRRFRVGSAPGVDFAADDEALGAASFELLRVEGGQVSVAAPRGAWAELCTRAGESRGVWDSSAEGVVTLARGERVQVGLGSLVAEASVGRRPAKAALPLADRVDFLALNVGLVCALVAALFVISAANDEASGPGLADELSRRPAVLAKLLVKTLPPRVATGGASGTTAGTGEPKKERARAAPAAAPRAPRAGTPGAPTRPAEDARTVLSRIFGAPGETSAVFDRPGLGRELRGAFGGIVGPAPSAALGLEGSLRGGNGGGAVGGPVGLGGDGLPAGGRRGGGGGGSPDPLVGMKLGHPTAIVPEIEVTTPDSRGGLDRELVRAVIHAHHAQVRACYEAVLPRFPSLAGKVSVRFTISADGPVSQAQVADDSTGNAELSTCVASRVRGWLFPKAKSGGLTVVTYPFVFKQSGE